MTKLLRIQALRAALACLAGLASLSPGLAQAVKLKEIATVQGVRANQLTGYGLVVGLDGTGDQTAQTPFTQQGITSMLQQMGINGGGELQVAVQAGFAQVLGAVRVDGTLVAKSPGLVADSITGGGVLKLGGISTSSRSRLEVQSELNGVTITAVATSPTDTLYVDSRVPSPTVQAATALRNQGMEA